MRKRDESVLHEVLPPEERAIEAIVARYQRVAPAVTRFARTLAGNDELQSPSRHPGVRESPTKSSSTPGRLPGCLCPQRPRHSHRGRPHLGTPRSRPPHRNGSRRRAADPRLVASSPAKRSRRRPGEEEGPVLARRLSISVEEDPARPNSEDDIDPQTEERREDVGCTRSSTPSTRSRGPAAEAMFLSPSRTHARSGGTSPASPVPLLCSPDLYRSGHSGVRWRTAGPLGQFALA